MQMEPSKCKQTFTISNKILDKAVEEKESCGSNEGSVSFDSFSVGAAKEKGGLKPSYRLKATRSVSRRKTARSFHYAKGHTKVEIVLTKDIFIGTKHSKLMNKEPMQNSLTR